MVDLSNSFFVNVETRPGTYEPIQFFNPPVLVFRMGLGRSSS